MSREKDFKISLSKFDEAIAVIVQGMLLDPDPYLEEISKRCHELIDVLHKVKYALSPDCVFDFAIENDINPIDINGEALIRCEAALKVLREYES